MPLMSAKRGAARIAVLGLIWLLTASAIAAVVGGRGERPRSGPVAAVDASVPSVRIHDEPLDKGMLSVGVFFTGLAACGAIIWKAASERQSMLDRTNNMEREIKHLRQELQAMRESLEQESDE